MPVLVVGADTPVGAAIVARLAARDGEIRAFVTDPTAADRLRSAGVKVATGDVSDASHVEGAALGAFAAVLVTAAVSDGRDLAFAPAFDIAALWVAAVAAAGATRVIVVGDDPPPRPDQVREWAIVPIAGRSPASIAEDVASLDEAARL